MNTHGIAILFVILFQLGGCGNKKDVKKIHECFDEYKTCSMNKDGHAIIDFVDQTSINYFTTMLEYAKTIKSDELQNLPMVDQLMVLTFRHRVPYGELKQMDGKKLIEWSVNNSVISRGNTEKLSMGAVTVENDKARGQIIIEGRVTPFIIKFSKEQDNWKIDITSLVNTGNDVLLAAYKKSKMTNQEFMIYILKASYGKEVDPNIWYRMVDHTEIPEEEN